MARCSQCGSFKWPWQTGGKEYGSWYCHACWAQRVAGEKERNQSHERRRALATSIREATQKRDLAAIERLLAQGADPNDPAWPYDTSPLYEAVSLDWVEGTQLLLQAGGRIDRASTKGFVPVLHAVTSSTMLAALLRAAPVAHLTSRHADLVIETARKGDVERVEVLRQHGLSLNVTGEHGVTALMGAAELGKVEMCKLLLDSGCDVHARNEYGGDALSNAIARYQVEVVRLLLNAGADPNLPRMDQTPPIVQVVQDLNVSSYTQWSDVGPRAVEIARLLLAAGADPNVERSGQTALRSARAGGFPELAAVFEQAGATAAGVEAMAVIFYRHSTPTAIEADAMLTHVRAQCRGAPTRLLLTTSANRQWPTSTNSFVVATVMDAIKLAGITEPPGTVIFSGGADLAVAWTTRRMT